MKRVGGKQRKETSRTACFAAAGAAGGGDAGFSTTTREIKKRAEVGSMLLGSELASAAVSPHLGRAREDHDMTQA